MGRDGKPQLKGRYVTDAERARGGLAVSRRTFLAGMAAGAAGLAVPAALYAAPPGPVIRPPGALPEPDFLRTCILCQECVRICPSNALRPSTWHAGLAGIGTPHLAARQGACQLLTSCPNLCAQVCPVGAILPIPKEQMKIAVAYVDRNACLAWDQGRKCLVCVEACPTGAALPFDGRVTVNPQKCTGCGKCEQSCPVADGAIHIRPLA
jgi:MauM/NapG family ferredoxin protein